MATRYVWGKYTYTYAESQTTINSNISPSGVPMFGSALIPITPDTVVEIGPTYTLNSQTGLSITGTKYSGVLATYSTTTNITSYSRLWTEGAWSYGEYYLQINGSDAIYYVKKQSEEPTSSLFQAVNAWTRANGGFGTNVVYRTSPTRITWPISSVTKITATPQQGSSTGTTSNSSSSAYPQNGVSGSSWYTYQGSDSIDATAVGYSNQSPMGGQSITINVTPATPTYGGTIQYTYQVQLSGGSWTTIATKTTATSQQYTIPAGTTSFAARVVANDTWGFSSSTYTTGSTLTVTNNLPPTAPGSISIGSVIGGQQCTITWTAATDPDGTVASYQLERQTDNGDTWTQIYSGADLTYTDTINADWATVNYRVKATDDDGDSGPYATGTMQTVNDGWLYFSGPPSDMGEQPAPFNFVFSIGSTGATSASSIAVTVIYDDETIYTGTVTSAQQITLPIDTRLTYAGDHDIIVTATASGFLAVTQQCDFTVPSVTLPNGGAAGIMEDDAGKPYYPATLARFVIGLKGLDANALFDRVYTGTYTGTGTSGSGNPCSVRTSFEPTLVFIQAAAASTATSGYWVNSAPGQSSQGNMIVNNNGTVTLCPVTWDAEAMTLSWYGTSAAAQLNASGTVYGIIALGGMA